MKNLIKLKQKRHVVLKCEGREDGEKGGKRRGKTVSTVISLSNTVAAATLKNNTPTASSSRGRCTRAFPPLLLLCRVGSHGLSWACIGFTTSISSGRCIGKNSKDIESL
jgi:hypothetical protein